MFNKYWFRRFYTAEFRMVINYYAESLGKKVVPAFVNISEEARQIREETYERLSMHFDPNHDDPADYAETAYHAGVDFYIMASNVKQGIVNMFTVGLYHLFEQQLLKLHRHELLTFKESRPPVVDHLLKVSVAQERLLSRAIDVKQFKSWGKLEELRLVANTVKHADGHSCDELKTIRPDMFVHPSSGPSWIPDVSYHQVVQPMSGEDLFITEDQFKEYVEVIKSFWDELALAVEALPD